MNNLKKYFGIALMGFILLQGCDGLLDTEPKQSIDSEQVLTNAENVKSVLVGAYDAMGDSDLYGGHLMLIPDYLAADDEFVFSGTYFGPRQLWSKAQQYDNANVEDTWVEAYNTINITNSVLSGLDLLEGDERDRVEGEAKLIRGMMYFELVRLYAPTYAAGETNNQPGVPVVLEPTTTINEEGNVSRASVEAVYTQVLDDLTDAKTLLNETNSVRSYYGNSLVASAVLSRVYLQQGEYEAARDEAHRVINSGNYELVENFANAFNRVENTTEDIFAMQVSAQDGTNSMFTFYSADSRGDIDIQQAHLDEYEAGDDRLALFYEDDEGVYRTGKWNNAVDGNVNLIRLAEMYLTRAETNFRLNEDVGDTPLNDVNTIRERVNLPLYDDESDITLEVILTERKLELMFEGNLLHDIKRTEGSVGQYNYDANILVLPIPRREIDSNPNICQNEGYQGRTC